MEQQQQQHRQKYADRPLIAHRLQQARDALALLQHRRRLAVEIDRINDMMFVCHTT